MNHHVLDGRLLPTMAARWGPTRFSFHRPPGGSGVPPVRTVTVLEGGRPVQRDLERTEIAEEPGRRFHYNNYNPLLVGLALERATGMPVATYLERRLWQPLGMEADGSWSLDSRSSGFEKMESGLNGRAIDFAKLGVLYAQGGAWQGHQLVPRDWVQDPTVVPTDDGSIPAPGYGFFWWLQSDRRPPAFFARGKYAQYIYNVRPAVLKTRVGGDRGRRRRWTAVARR